MSKKEPPLLDTKAVAAILGVQPKTVSQYLVESKTTGRPKSGRGRYVDNPFPEPDGHIGKSPWWALAREQEIRDWDSRRAGQGRGGGPKPKKAREQAR